MTKTIIERGASWTLEETKLLLALWGQDLVARQATCLKRTKEVYEKISEKFHKEGFERTPDQVRTRVFNMIAEYRRILKDPNPERMKKCIFFEALHKIYQAKHLSDVKSAIDDYELVNPYSPGSSSRMSEMEDASSDGISHGADDSSMDTSNTTSNNVSNTNNSTNNASAATSKSNAATSDAKTNTTTNNISGGGSSSGKSGSATTTDVGNSISDNSSTAASSSSSKKTPAGEQANRPTFKRYKRESSPKAGTSHGDTNQEDSFASVSGDSKHTFKVSTNNNHSGGLTNSGSSKQQSLLATAATPSSSSTTTTPINKFSNQAGNSTSFININSTKLPIIRSQLLGHTNGNESININGTPTPTRLPTTAAITSHQLYQAPVNTFDVTSSALLIDRMFAHLSKESENMREWIALEKERIALERARRSQETEREIRRERVLIETLMKFQEQWISFVTRLDPRIVEGAAGPLPELNIPKDVLEPLNDSKGAHDTPVAVSSKTTIQSSSSSLISPANRASTSTSSTSPVAATTITVTTSGATLPSTTTTATTASTPSPAAPTTAGPVVAAPAASVPATKTY